LNSSLNLLRKIFKAANEAERSLIARKIIAAAHKDGAPHGGSARSRYGASRSVIPERPFPRLQRAACGKVFASQNFFYAPQHHHICDEAVFVALEFCEAARSSVPEP
jgi:hypothetical protein